MNGLGFILSFLAVFGLSSSDSTFRTVVPPLSTTDLFFGVTCTLSTLLVGFCAFSVRGSYWESSSSSDHIGLHHFSLVFFDGCLGFTGGEEAVSVGVLVDGPAC